MIDPEYSRTFKPTIVTHSHADHSAALTSSGRTYTTQATIDLFHAAHNNRVRNCIAKEFYEPFEVGNFEIEFIKAGHLLGAAQIIVRQGNDTFHFTGDFCPEELLTVEQADMPKDVDVCVIDSTYGDSRISFNSRPETRQRLFIWAIAELNNGKLPIINVAHVGGAQEIIKLFNNLASNLPIYVHPKIAAICEVYNNYGIELNYQEINTSPIKIESKSLLLMPRSTKSLENIKNLLTGRKLSKAIVTGQSAKYGFSSFDFAAPLSTHASFVELVDTALKVNPSTMITHYGYPDKFAELLNNEHNIPALELKKCEKFKISKLTSKSYTKNQVNSSIWSDWY